MVAATPSGTTKAPRRRREKQTWGAYICSYFTATTFFTVLAVFLFFYSMKYTVIAFTPSVTFMSSRHRLAGEPFLVTNQVFDSNLNMVSSTTAVEESSISDTESGAQFQLAAHTFAGLVERALIDKFGENDIQRVLESWRLLEQGYEHRKEIVTDNGNTVEQFAHSFISNLPVKCWWDADQFEWAQALKNNYEIIKREFQTVTQNMKKLEKEGNNVWAGALTDDASSYGLGWKTLVLMNRGMWDETNVHLFPKTSKIIHDSKIPCVEAFFASMEPRSDIKMHSDFTNFVLTSHLALDIPFSGNNKCRLTVGDETREWINGQVTLFDTSVMHDAINESDKTRYILMFRVWHPHLTQKERKALQFIYSVLELPELVSTDRDERFLAQKALKKICAFPKKHKKKQTVSVAAKSRGFGN